MTEQDVRNSGATAAGAQGWRAAMDRALYGPDGFYRRRGPATGPAAHFRTSVHASPLFAGAVARLLCRVDEALGHPTRLGFTDMAAGRGELVTGVLAALPEEVAARTVPYAVEIADRPDVLDPRIHWLPEPPQITGLLFANEWLDNVPLDIAETDDDGVLHQVLVGPDGLEQLAGPLRAACPEDAEWADRWWPVGPADGAGLRVEIGRPRDLAWAAAVRSVDRGLAIAVDYAHTRAGRPPFGSLTGFREGRECPPVPDGRCDLTAHVALDACARPGSALLSQREALHSLGVTGRRPPLSLASSDPTAYVRALASAGSAAELTDRGGLGDFGWLVQGTGDVDAAGLVGEPVDRGPGPR